MGFVACSRPAALLLAALAAGCAGARETRIADPGPVAGDLQTRLAARAASLVGYRGAFGVAGERFNADCTGFIEAVYQAEGIPLRALMRRTAPFERSGVAAAFRTMKRYGVVFGGGGAWPAPGDLVFWHDTYDRNRNGRVDDPLTHVGIVQYVSGGTVVFVHRGGHAVARGAMNPGRPDEARAGGFVLNSPLRSKSRRVRGAPVLAGALFAAYGRIDPAKVSRFLRSPGMAAR